jgi:ATP-dependent protease HslVU (ClpYQ) peptidase subunit
MDRKIYILTIKETGKKYAYSNMSELFRRHKRTELGVAQSTIYCGYNLKEKKYENRKITIELLYINNPGKDVDCG